MNILVTGAGSQLGNELQRIQRDSEDRYFFTDVREGYEPLDITDFQAIKAYVRAHDIGVVVNCAAWTNVDGAEDPDKYPLVELLNAKAPEYLALAMKEVGGLLVHISSDYVFGGDNYNTPCKEDQKGTPTGVYGKTKLLGEQLIEESGAQYVILRTSWLYSPYGKNFLKTMLHLTAARPQLNVVFDQVGTPTYAGDLARAIVTILKDYSASGSPYPRTGTYHFSNEGVCSWFDFAKRIAFLSGHKDCEILPCHSSEFPSPVKRPAYSVLDKSKIKETFGLKIPYWTDSLANCLAEMSE